MTEKKMWTLKVDEEFKTLIPPLTEEERKLLEESILKNGCEMPILVWNGIIVDGHKAPIWKENELIERIGDAMGIRCNETTMAEVGTLLIGERIEQTA